MLTVGLPHYLTLAAILFTLGIFGIFLNRKNVIVILMSIELMLLAVNINFIAFSAFLGDLVGQVFALLVLPFWRPGDALYGPEGAIGDAPRGVTEATRSAMVENDRLFVSQRWSSFFELAIPGLPVMVDYRIELFPEDVWADYIHISNGRADWAGILDRWGVTLIAASEREQGQLLPFLREDAGWSEVFTDEEGAVFRRAG